MDELPEAITEMIGRELTYITNGKSKCGVCQEIKKSPVTIVNIETKGRRKSIILKLKPKDGSRAFWTRPVPYGVEEFESKEVTND